MRPEFTGSASEYFRIWIVNLLFTLATLGIYSAWAKVRKKRYFYGSTRFDGDSFDYFASPKAILKGRLVAFAALLLYAFAGALLGGIDSPGGAVLGGLIVGVLENVVGTYIGTEIKLTVALVLIVGVLVVRPQGLFGSVQVTRV